MIGISSTRCSGHFFYDGSSTLGFSQFVPQMRELRSFHSLPPFPIQVGSRREITWILVSRLLDEHFLEATNHKEHGWERSSPRIDGLFRLIGIPYLVAPLWPR